MQTDQKPKMLHRQGKGAATAGSGLLHECMGNRRVSKAVGSRVAEDMGAMAGLRHAEVMNGRIAEGVSILYDPWRDALRVAKEGVRKYVRLVDKIAYERCFMATFRDNFILSAQHDSGEVNRGE